MALYFVIDINVPSCVPGQYDIICDMNEYITGSSFHVCICLDTNGTELDSLD